MASQKPPTDLRRQRQRDERMYLLAFIVLLVCVGGALIAWRYGTGAAVLGIACALSILSVVGLLWLVLVLIERWLA